MSRLPDDVLGDIGISRDEIMCALRSRAIRHSEAGAAGTTIERTCRSTLREPSATVAGVSLPVQKKTLVFRSARRNSFGSSPPIAPCRRRSSALLSSPCLPPTGRQDSFAYDVAAGWRSVQREAPV
ncbi:hypothetical protein [Mesorhizobium sp.]|uniref:hypothetical protein n=1 Tax=Mesorhizobium sp. TaxID=1871066 RepID=UPI00338E9E17